MKWNALEIKSRGFLNLGSIQLVNIQLLGQAIPVWLSSSYFEFKGEVIQEVVIITRIPPRKSG